MRVLFRALEALERLRLAWGMIVIAALTITNVFSRTLFGVSLAFAEELSQFLIVFATFIGLGYGAAQGRHIRMTAIYDQLGARARKALMVLIAGSTSALLLWLACYAVSYVGTVGALGTVSPALQVPLWIVYLSAPLGLVLAGIQYALTVVKNLVAPDVWLSWEKKDEYEEPVGY